MTCKKLITMLAVTAAPIAVTTAASPPSVATDAQGVTLTAENGQTVRIQPVGDKIMRISAVPAGSQFSQEASLIVVPQESVPTFTTTDEGNRLVVSARGICAAVNYADGQVSFYRPNGALLLAERHGGRSFTPINVEGTDGYTVSQTFASPDDHEALYGLGQHQADEWNYKGRSEELFQYNTKVSVPMIVSTGGYGVLWDSYSLCRFGNPAEYEQLGQAFTLTDNDGQSGALTGTYVAKDGTTLTRREPQIYFENLKTHDLSHVINLPEDFRYNGSQVTYEGTITPLASGQHDFILYYSGYQTVEIDGQQVVPERWRTAWNPNSYKFSVNLTANKPAHLKISWTPNGDVAYCGLRVHSPRPAEDRNAMTWWGEMQSMIDYYMIAGDSMDDVVRGYRTLTGQAPIMPRWALGYWQSREKYNTSDEVLSTLAEYRSRQIPIDNIVIDWLHWPQDSWGCHEFDPQRFPNPKAMVDSIHDMHGRVMVSVWPKFYASTEHFKEFDSQGWMYRQAIKDNVRDWVGPGYLGSFYDAYSEPARRLFWHQIQDHYYPLGIDAWWMDASEPNVRDCVDIDYRKALCGPTALGPSTKYFNAYALMNAEAIYDGQRGVDPQKRVFLLTRSGYAGQQRYSTATWSGDIATRWEDMKAQLSAGLNFAVSGVPWWTMDIGGFCVEDRYVAAQQLYDQTGEENADLKEWRELNTRWHQFGAFCPLYRSHGQWPLREIWNIAPEGHPAYNSICYYNTLRYRLMPYLYALNARVSDDGYTLMRPLAMDFTPDVLAREVSDQFMLGPALMACPVTAYQARTRTVYFPQGSSWVNFYDGTVTQGGQYAEVDAPYERMPLYVRAGSILPMGPEGMQWSGDKRDGVLTVCVCPGQDCDFTLYDDDGLTYAYEQGQCERIPLHWDDATSTLTIGDRQGSWPGMLAHRTLRVVKIQGTGALEAQGKDVEYDGHQLAVNI
ncbi:MAG: DUF5110 domain-containing protein [Bacteroidales bacterium]|nr:DUF5110 domain-containing protein [Bacteroidales bacterium]